MALNAYRYRFYGGSSTAEQDFLLAMQAKGYTAASVLETVDQSMIGVPPMRWQTGTYVRNPVGTTAVGTLAMTLSRSYATAVYVPYGASIDRASVEITAAGGAGSVVRFGLYSDLNGAPGTLISDDGTVDSSTTGFKEDTVAWTELTASLYWVVTVAQVGTAPTVRTVSTPIETIAPYRSTTLTNTPDAWCVYGGNITGALPSSFGAITAHTNGPMVIVRVA